VPNVPDSPVEPSGLPNTVVDDLFSHLNCFSKLAVAVSGGADSLCLLVLLREWQKRQAWPGTLEVLCVDHGLRPESGTEAEFVAGCAQELGLVCTLLRWQDQKPAGNLQAEARRARYRLMAAHMAQSGAEALVLAHHRDDQAETFLDRLTRGSGTSGLGAMAGDEPFGPEGLRLLRPFLGVRKSRLEACLSERGRTWCADPSNQDSKYKRSRLRKIMSLLEDEGLSADRLARTADNMRRADEALEATLHDFAVRHLVDHPAGPLKVSRPAFEALPAELRFRLLSALASRVTGLETRPRLRKLIALDDTLRGTPAVRAPMAGTMFETDQDTLFCWRETGRQRPETLVGVRGEGTWDHRFRFIVTSSGPLTAPDTLCLGPLSEAPLTSRDVHWPAGWPRAAFDCMPVIWSAENVLKVPVPDLLVDPVNFRRCEELELERLPIRAKLHGNYDGDGDALGEN